MPSEPIVRWDEPKPVEMLPGLIRRTLGYTQELMIVEFRAEAGVVVPIHSHPHQQVGYAVSGEVELTIDGAAKVCKPGDSWSILGGVPHGAHFLTECVVIDSFSPIREDYL